MRKSAATGAVAAALVLLLIALRSGRAEVVRLEIRQRQPFAGHAFGRTGPYERITGRLYCEVSPADPLNAVVTDIGLAPAMRPAGSSSGAISSCSSRLTRPAATGGCCTT